LFHEISYKATIRNSTFRWNGFKSPFAQPGACDGAGIYVSNSPDVEVYGNDVEDNLHGICGREDDRGSGAYGPHHVTNLNVHDNRVRQTDGGRIAGISDTDPAADPYTVAANNRWAKNVYECGPATKFRWTGNLDKTRLQWQAPGRTWAAPFAGC